jgi:hypothetical protein
MCLACAAVAAPEVAVIVGGYAAVRFGRPVARIRDALGRTRVSGPRPDEAGSGRVPADDPAAGGPDTSAETVGALSPSTLR